MLHAFVRAVVAVFVLVALASCSSGGAHAKRTGAAAPCPIFQQLDDIVASVSRGNISDPQVSKRALDDGVQNYVTTLTSLRKVVPVNLQGDVDRVEAAVHQYRFQDAAAARGALDAYAATTCGRRAAPISTSTTTTVITGDTSTTTSGSG